MNTRSQCSHQSRNILAFDTSRDEASLALWAHEKMHTISIPIGTGSHSQAACLITMIQDLLFKEAIDFQDLDVIATSKGPGSFTGIRIGLATAQGLMSSTQAVAFVPTTFEVAVFGLWSQKIDTYFATITTKRGSYYCQSFDKTLAPQGPANIMTDLQIDDYLAHNPQMIRVNQPSLVSAEKLIELYLYKCSSDQIMGAQASSDNWQASSNILSPYYLHDPEFVKQKPWSL